MSVIRKRFKVEDVLTDPTSIVLADSAGAYGVKRDDTGAVVVAADTAMTKNSTGDYQYEFTDPDYDLTYTYCVKIVYAGATYYFAGDMSGPVSADETETGTGGGGTSVAMLNVSSLLPLVSPNVRACPEAVQLQALGLMFRSFCKETDAWRETFDVTTVEDETTYDLTTQMEDRDATLARVAKVYFDDDTDDEMDEDNYVVTVENELYFEDTDPYDYGSTMNVVTVIHPNVTGRTAPAWLLNRWGDVIAAGALYYLQATKGRPWSDRDEAAVSFDRYQYGVGEAKKENITERRSGDVRVTPGDFV